VSGLPGGIGLAWVLRLARPHARRVALALLAGVGAAAAAVGLTATSAWLISRAAEQPPVLSLMVAIVAVRAFGVGRGVLRYAERLAAHDAAFRILAELRLAAYERLRALAPAGLAEFRTGDLLARLVTDIDGLADVWLRVVLPYAVAGIVGAGAVVLLLTLVPLAGVVLAATLALVALGAPLAAAAVARRADQGIAPARGALAAAALELLRGAPELVLADASERRLDDLASLDRGLRAAETRSALGSGLGTLISGLAEGAAVFLALVTGVLALRAGHLGGVALAVVVLTPIAAHELVASLAPAAQQLPRLRSAVGRVAEMLTRPDPVREPVHPAPLPPGPYGVRIRGLDARYPAADRDVLRGIDLDVQPGERALVTGPSGSGKSTLAAVLLRFLDPTGGRVELTTSGGAIELTDLASEDVRRVVGLSAQDPHIFDTSIRENLRIALPQATDDELASALRIARLDGWVAALPDGLDTLVGEHGTALSGGQRQRIELARAVLADRPIVIFDEPTEHLDGPTADALTADLLAATAGRTTIFITHRPALVRALSGAVAIDLGAPSRGTKRHDPKVLAPEARGRNGQPGPAEARLGAPAVGQ
jgi:thiol reductant ABC exporter CydC subunit